MATQNEKATIDLVINGQQAQTSLRDVGRAATVAKRELAKLKEDDDPAAFKKKLAEYRALADAETDMRTRMNGAAKGWAAFRQNVVGTLTGVLGGNLLTAGLQQIIGLAPVVLDHSLKMADSFADIEKNAGMTGQQVEALNQKLYDMPTRTATEELRAMAATGGQFGVAAGEMDKFVDGANRVNVAIGSEFGSVDETVENVLGLRNVFANLRSDNIDQDLLRIGNALNVLGAEGKASAPVLSDFSNRIGGVLVPLGVAEGKVLGISAALSELNVTAERGSTATVNIFQKMLTETQTFAKVAGVPLKEYRDLIQRDIYGAFVKYVEGLKKVSGNQVEFMAVLEKSKLTGAGEMEVLSKLASNTDMLAKKTATASDALTKTDSITEEYNKKNLALAVGLKKLADLKERILSKLTPLAEGFVALTVKMLGLNSASEQVNTAFDNQLSAVKSLEKDVKPLLKRHDELKAKTQLTKKEQDELNSIIATVAKTIPTAVTQFDAMGNAMAISTDKAREYVKQQKEVLKYTNRQALAETDEQLTDARKQQRLALEKRQRGTVSVGGTSASDRYRERPMTAAEAAAAQAEVDKQNQVIADLEARRSGLSGDYLGEKESTRRRNERRARLAGSGGGAQPGIELPKDGPGIDLGETPEEKAARKKRERETKAAEKHQDDFERLMDESRQRTAKANDNEFEKEQVQFGQHYAKLLDLAGTDAAKRAQVEELMYQELTTIEARELARQEKARREQDEKEDKQREEDRNQQQEDDELAYDAAIAQAERMRQAAVQKEKAPAARRTGAAGFLQEAGLLDVADPEADQLAKRQAELDAEQAFLTQKLLLQQTFGKSTIETEKQLTDLYVEQGLRRSQAEQRFAELRQNLMGGTIAALKGLVSEHTVAYKAMIVAEKAFAIAQIWINTQKEVSAIAAAPDINILGLGAPVVKGIFTGLAYAKGAAAAASVASVAMKDTGGFTNYETLYGGASGFVDKPTLVNKGKSSYMVGEARPEWIMGGAMLQNPVMANLARALEAVQVSGAYRTMGTVPQAAASGSGASGASTGGVDLVPLLLEMRQLRASVEQQGDKKVQLNYRLLEEYGDQVEQVRAENRL